jgi:tetratricopeptide (TPR) repeat protein
MESGGRSAVTLIHFIDRWIIVRGLLETAQRTTVAALARPEMQAREGLRCRGLWLAGEFDYYLGRYASAQARVEECLAIAREIGEPRREAEALRLLGYLLHAGGDAAQARRRFDEALAIVRTIDDPPGLAATLNGLAELFRAERAFAAAIPCYEEALALCRKRGDRRAIAVQLGNFAKVAVSLAHRDHARCMLEESLAVSDELGSLQARLNALEGCAGFACLLRRWDTAARWMSAVEALWKASGFFREPADADYAASVAAQTRAGLSPVEHRAAEEAGRCLRYDDVAAEARALLRSAEGAADGIRSSSPRAVDEGTLPPAAAVAAHAVSGRARRPRGR